MNVRHFGDFRDFHVFWVGLGAPGSVGGCWWVLVGVGGGWRGVGGCW